MSVVIEFTKDTKKRQEGDRLAVDEQSARSFVDRQKVAKRVGDEKPSAPTPPPAPAGDQ